MTNQGVVDLAVTDTPDLPQAGRKILYVDNNGALALLASNGAIDRLQPYVGGLQAGTVVVDVNDTTLTGVAVDRATGQPALLPGGTFITLIEVVVVEQFGEELVNFQLGIDGQVNLLIDDVEHNLRDAAPSVARIINNQIITEAVPLLITIDQTGNSTGEATLLVRYSAF